MPASYKCANYRACHNYVNKAFELCPQCRQAAREAEQGQPVYVDKRDGLTYHDKTGDHRHGEKAGR
jgi:hypothetical protein